MKNLLAQQGMMKALSGKKPEGTSNADSEELEARAVDTIQLYLADEIMYHVINVKTQAEV